jgi:hypothetical protein
MINNENYVYERDVQMAFTMQGIKQILSTYDNAKAMSKHSSVFTSGAAIDNVHRVLDSYGAMACFDILVELGIVVEIVTQHKSAWQHRVFKLARPE